MLILKENKKVSFGIGLGLGIHTLRIEKSPSFGAKDSIFGINPQSTPGFFLQFITNYNFSSHFSLRGGPLFHYKIYNVEYKTKYPTIQNQSFIFDYFKISMPLDIVFKSDIINNFRFYIYTGAYASYNFTSNQNLKNILYLRIKNYEIGLQGGVGFLFNGEITITGLELRYQYGLTNIFIQDPNYLYSNSLDQLKSSNILLVINFL